jgi:hypothetical protein
MLCRETVAVYCENHTEHINTLCGQNAGILYIKAGGTLGLKELMDYTPGGTKRKVQMSMMMMMMI